MISFIISFYMWSIRSSKSAPLIALGILIGCIIGNSLTFMYFDEQSFKDAIWYSIISVTTIGYGDYSASSTGARIGTIVFIVLGGLGSFSFAIGWTLDKMSVSSEKRRKGMSKVFSKNHVLIVNFPSDISIRNMIDEIRTGQHDDSYPIVIVSDAISELPFNIKNVEFVHGSTIETETYKRANIDDAIAAFVLSTDYNDSKSDALVSTIVGVIEGIKPDIKTIAECIQRKHKNFFQTVGCDSVIFTDSSTKSLMVQEFQNCGITDVFDVITSNKDSCGDTIFSCVMRKDSDITYNAIAHAFVDQDGNLISVKRKGSIKVESNFPKDMTIKEGDTVVFIASTKFDEAYLKSMVRTEATCE